MGKCGGNINVMWTEKIIWEQRQNICRKDMKCSENKNQNLVIENKDEEGRAELACLGLA